MSDTTPGSEPTPEPNQPVEPTASTPPPAAPAPGQAAAPTGPDYAAQASQAADKLKAGNPLDLGIIGAGLLVLIASLMNYHSFTVEFLGQSEGEGASAWDSGFFAWFGVLAAVGAAGLLVTKLLGVDLSLPVPLRDVVLGLFGLALLCTLIAFFTSPFGDCSDAASFGVDVCDIYDTGHGLGYWLALLATIAGTALSFLRRSAD